MLQFCLSIGYEVIDASNKCIMILSKDMISNFFNLKPFTSQCVFSCFQNFLLKLYWAILLSRAALAPRPVNYLGWHMSVPRQSNVSSTLN